MVEMFLCLDGSIFTHPKTVELCNHLECSKGEAIGNLASMWYWCMGFADESGLLPKITVADIEGFMYDTCRRGKVTPHEFVSALLEMGWIENKDGSLYIHDWAYWQRYWYKYKRKREKDRETKRVQSEKKKSETPVVQGPVLVKKETPPKPVKKSKPDYTDDFEKFWSIYPRKDAKEEAFKKFSARLKEDTTADQMIQAARNYVEDIKNKHTEPQYIMQAKRFVGPNHDFIDYLPKEGNAPPGNPFDGYYEDFDEFFGGEHG